MNNHTKNSLIVSIKVTTNSSSNKLAYASINDDETITLRAYLTASPEKGKANASLIKLFSKILGIKKTSIEILRGHTNNKKLLSLFGITFEELHKALQR